MATDNRILIEVELDQAKARKEFIRLTKLITAQRSALTKYKKILKESGGTNEEAAEEVANLSRAIKENSKDLRIYERELNATDNSTEALRVQTSKLQREQNKLNTSTKQGQKRFAELEAQLKENREQLNSNSKAAGSFKDNIGNYTASIQEAISGNALFANSLGDAAEGFKILQLAGGPITILISAIAAALTAFFTQTREGQKIFQRLAFVVKAVFGGILTQIGQGVSALIDFVSSINSVEDAFDKVGALVKDFSFTKLVEGATEFSKQLEKAARFADRLAQRNIEIEEQEIKLRKLAAQAQRQAEEARKNRDDETKTFAERIAFNNEVLRQENERKRLLTTITNNRIEAIKNEVRASGKQLKDDINARKEVLELELELQEIQEDFTGRTTEQLTEGNALRREALQTQANLERAQLEQRLIEEKLTAEEILKLRLEIIAKEEKAALVGLKESSTQAALVRQEFLNKRLEAQKEFNEKEAELTKEGEDKKTQIELEAKQERADLVFDQAQANADRELELLTTSLDKEVEARKNALEQERAIEQARVQVQSNARNQFSQLTQSIIQLFGERSAAAKAAFVFEQGLAINDVIVRGVQAAALISSTYPPPLNIPFLALNAAATAAGVATIAQQTVQGFKEGGFIDALSGQPVPNRSFARGGFTGNAGTSTPVGAVHGGEMVISAPRVKALGGPKAVSAMTGQSINGFASGGMVSTNAVSNVRTATFAQQIEAAISNMPSPIVTVKDFDEVKRRSDRVLVKANQ